MTQANLSKDFATKDKISSQSKSYLSKGKIKPFKKGKPCPICNIDDGRCRSAGDSLTLCMTWPDGGAVNGWHFLGASKDGLWGKFVPERDRTYTEAERREYRDRQQRREREQHQAEAQRRAAAMPIAERDHWYRLLLQELTLNECDRSDLRRRGLSDELIAERGYRSVAPGQRLTECYPANLPGVTDGRVTVSGAGYLIPAFTVEGAIAGFQIRLRDAESGRYRWLSSTDNPVNLANGEPPITVAYPARPHPDRAGWLGFAEGILKPQLAADRLGYPVIGASGGNFGGAGAQIQAEIAHLKPSKLVLLPDGGAIKNPRVVALYRKLAALVPELQVLWWGQLDKGTDVDEVAPAQLATAKLLDWSQFAAIADEHQPSAKQQPSKIERFRQQVQEFQAWASRLDVEPSEVITSRYLPPGELPEPGAILLIDAAMGAGKTSSSAKGLVVDQAQRYPDGKLISLGHRNALQSQTLEIFGGQHHSQFETIEELLSQRFWGLCFDSIWKIDPDKITPNSILFLDETSAGLSHLLDGSTLRDKRVFAINRFCEIAQRVVELGGWIVCAEDGLTNLELGFLQELVGDVPIHYTKSNWQAENPYPVEVYSTASVTLEEIQRRLETGQSLILAADSADWLREVERALVSDRYLQPDEIVIVDGSSSQEPWAKALTKNPDQWLAQRQPRVFGYSPSLESGISVTVPLFDAMAVHLTNLPPKVSRQIPNRYRVPVPRFGYVKEFAVTPDDSCKSFSPDAILDDLKRTTKGIAQLTAIAEFIAKQEADGTDSPDLAGTLKRLLEGEAQEVGWLKHWARIKARQNYGKSRLRAALIEDWEAKGHTVNFRDYQPNKALQWQQTQARESLDREESQAFAQTDCSDLELSEAYEILNRLGSTVSDRRKAAKKIKANQLPGAPLDDSDFVYKVLVREQGKFLKATELLWAVQHPDWQQEIDKLNLFGQLTRQARRGEIVWAPDIRSKSLQADLIARSPLQDCLHGEAYSDDSDPVARFKEWALWNHGEIKRVLRLNVNEAQSGTAILNKFLRKLGYEVESFKRGGRGSQVRWYKIANLADIDREIVLNALSERFTAKVRSNPELYQQDTVSNICNSDRPLQMLDTEVPDPDPETLDDIRSWWSQGGEARTFVLQSFPGWLLRRAIAS